MDPAAAVSKSDTADRGMVASLLAIAYFRCMVCVVGRVIEVCSLITDRPAGFRCLLMNLGSWLATTNRTRIMRPGLG